jgi:hypothetical protein
MEFWSLIFTFVIMLILVVFVFKIFKFVLRVAFFMFLAFFLAKIAGVL